MAIINIRETFKTINGEDIIEEKNNITLAKVIVNALLATFPDETTLSGEEKLLRWEMAMKVNSCQEDEIELKSEEIVKLKVLIAKGFSTTVVGQAWKLLES